MAVKFIETSSKLSTSSWLAVDAYAFPTGATVYNAVNLSTAKYIPVTFAQNGNQKYISFLIASYTQPTVAVPYVITVALEQYIGSTWTQITTNTATYTPSNMASNMAFISIPLTSSAVTTAANTWRYKVSATTTIYLQGTSSTTPYYAVVLDNAATKAGTGDMAVFNEGVTLTIDEDWTFGDATLAFGATLANNSSIVWEYPVVSTHTLTVNQVIYIGKCNSKIIIGSSTNPVPFANRAIIKTGNNNLARAEVYYIDYNSTAVSGVEMYGEKRTDIIATIPLEVPIGVDTFDTAVDMSATWTVGDTVILLKHIQKTGAETEFTISSISGKTIKLSGTLTRKLFAGGYIMNKTVGLKQGICVENTTTTSTAILTRNDNYGYIKLSGVSGKAFRSTGTTGNWDNTNLFENLFFDCSSASGCINHSRIIINGAQNGTTTNSGTVINNLYFYNPREAAVSEYAVINNGNYATISNIYGRGMGGDTTNGNFVFTGANNTISNVHWFDTLTSGWGIAMVTALTNSTLTNITLNGSSRGVKMDGSINVTLTNVYLYGMPNYLTAQTTVSGCTFNNCSFGVGFTGSLSPTTFLSAPSVYVNYATNNCLFAIAPDLTACIPGSSFSADTYNATTNYHRDFYVYGEFSSTGSGLTDTTVHTSGTGKFAVRFESTSSTLPHTWSFYTPTGNIQNKTMTVGVWCKINNATYYAGTHQLPRLTINYDNGTTTYTQATASTDWQYLPVNFTPITTYGQITVTLSTMTDATGSNAYVYFDDFSVLYPAGYKLDLGGMDLWANGLPVTPPIATVLSANDVWSASTATEYGTDTQGEKLKSLKNASLLIDGEIIV